MGVSYQFSKSTMLTIRVVSSVAQFIGIVLSIFRVWFRLQIRRLWWEDAWACIACLCSIALLTSEWMYLKGEWTVSIVGFWIYSLMLTCVVWAVRMSLLFSVARILNPTHRARYMVTALAALFSLIALAYITVKNYGGTLLIEVGSSTLRFIRCPRVGCLIQSDCISDAILIALPVRLLWGMNLPTKRRRMIIAIFSSSIIVTTASIFRAVSQMMSLTSLVGVATDLEVACCIITCNLLVIATLVYRIFQRRVSTTHVPESDSEDDDYTTPVRAGVTTLAMTTVDFSALYNSEDYSSRQDTCTSEVRPEHSCLSDQ
ncbi:hypothetical protein V8E55_011458 [Tylopilus felleus]